MKKLLLLTIITITSCITIAQAEIPAAKRVEIEKMLRLTGVEKLMGQMKTQMINSLKPSMPKVPETFWTKFESKMNMGELLEKFIPLYDKYYTLEDLKAVNAFYQSSAGQRVLSTMPQIMQESMAIGQKWGEQVGAQATAEYERESGNKGQK